MTFLILGVLLWAYSHLMKRVTPGFRASLGDGPGKGVAALLTLVSLGLMIYGYGQADVVMLWSPPTFLVHVNNFLMILAVVLLNLGYNRGRLRGLMRHPMLTSVKVWALAHLLVNGDLASVVLFGGILAWAVVDVIMINRMEPPWVRPAPGPVVNDVIYLGLSAVLLGVIAYVHTWLGYFPFG